MKKNNNQNQSIFIDQCLIGYDNMVQIVPLLLSHHPICEPYRKHMVGKKHPICRGCLFFYPSFWFIIIIGILNHKAVLLIHDYTSLVSLIGLGLMATYLIKFAFSHPNHFIDDLIHVLTGVGYSFIALSIFASPFPPILKILAIIAYQSALSFATFRRITEFDKICKNCPEFELGKKCLGFTSKSFENF